MDRDEIIRMAREATGLETVGASDMGNWVVIERFAALVAAAGREACAKVCEDGWKNGIGAKHQGNVFATAIRARGEQ